MRVPVIVYAIGFIMFVVIGYRIVQREAVIGVIKLTLDRGRRPRKS